MLPDNQEHVLLRFFPTASMTMDAEKSPLGLQLFFDKWLRQSFGDLCLSNGPIVTYLAELLSRFARTDNLCRIKSWGCRQLLTVVEMLLEAEARAHPDDNQFNPFDERQIRKHVGDYTLFMTGIFREYVEHLNVLDLYVKEGELAYLAVSGLDEVAERDSSILFRRLFREFEQLSGVLDYMRKVYFRPELHEQKYRSLVDQLGHW